LTALATRVRDSNREDLEARGDHLVQEEFSAVLRDLRGFVFDAVILFEAV